MKRALLWLLALAGMAAAWETAVAAGAIDPLFFPPPSKLAVAAGRLWENGELPKHLAATLRRCLIGLALGAVTGTALGLLLGTVAVLRRTFDPVLAALYATPKLSLLPLLMLVFGLGETPRLVLIGAAAFLTMAIQAADAVRQTDPVLVDAARNCGAGWWLMLRRVYWPSSLPGLFTGLRLAFGRAMLATISVELIGCPDGLGSMIYIAWQTLYAEKLYLGVFITMLLGSASHFLFLEMEKRLVPWRAES